MHSRWEFPKGTGVERQRGKGSGKDTNLQRYESGYPTTIGHVPAMTEGACANERSDKLKQQNFRYVLPPASRQGAACSTDLDHVYTRVYSSTCQSSGSSFTGCLMPHKALSKDTLG